MISIPKLRELAEFDTSREPQLVSVRDEVVALWETVTGRLWTARTGYVQTIQPEHDRVDTLFLELSPVTSITTVRSRPLTSGVSGGASWTTHTEGTDFDLIGDRRLLRYGLWDDLVEVTYDGGTSDASGEIQRALAVQARFIILRTEEGRVIAREQAVKDAGTAAYERADLHPYFRDVAARHTRVA